MDWSPLTALGTELVLNVAVAPLLLVASHKYMSMSKFGEESLAQENDTCPVTLLGRSDQKWLFHEEENEHEFIWTRFETEPNR